LQKELNRIYREKQAQQQQQVPSGSIFSQFGPSLPFPTLPVSASVFPTLIGDPIPLIFSNLSFFVQSNQLLTFFEKYSLEVRRKNQEKQMKKVSKNQKPQRTTVSSSIGVPSSSRKDEDIYPKNPEKQPSSQQLTISMIKEEESFDSISVQSIDTSSSQTHSEQESFEIQSDSSCSTEEEQGDITGILMADRQPESSGRQPES
jgi:hypothetical protein